MCLFVCACEWACALLLHRRNGPTKFLEKSYYHMYTGVGWSEMFMFWFIFLSSRVFTTCGLFCLRGVDFLQMCCALMALSVSVASSAWLVFFFSDQRRINFLRSILGWLVVCGFGGGGGAVVCCGVGGHRCCCFCSDNCHCGSGSIDKRRSTLN